MKIIQNTENVIEINKVLAALQYSFTHSYVRLFVHNLYTCIYM